MKFTLGKMMTQSRWTPPTRRSGIPRCSSRRRNPWRTTICRSTMATEGLRITCQTNTLTITALSRSSTSSS
jgi:hypothetical protein